MDWMTRPDPFHHTDGVQMGQEEVHHHHIGLDMGDRVHNLPSVFFHGFDIQAVRTHGCRAGDPKGFAIIRQQYLDFLLHFTENPPFIFCDAHRLP